MGDSMTWTTILFLLTLVRPAAAPAADVSGSWNVMGSVQGDQAGGTFSANCTFQQKDEKFDGVCTRASGDSQASGHVNGRSVDFQYDIDNAGATRTFLFNGTLDEAGTAMTGAVSLSGIGEGTFTANKQKKQ
jgi:hypothetical protein